MFSVDDYYELTILHRTIMEAKFSTDSRDTALPGSPILANLSNKVVDSLIHIADVKGDKKTSLSWCDWRKAEEHTIEIKVIKNHIIDCKNWKNWSDKQKREYVSILLSPFSYEESFLAKLVQYGNDNMSYI